MKKAAIFLTLGMIMLLSACSSNQQTENDSSSNNKNVILTKIKKQVVPTYTDIKEKTAAADTALSHAEETPTEENYLSAEKALDAVPYKVIELTSRLKAIRTKLDDLKNTQTQETADSSTSSANPQPGNAENEQAAQDRYWEAINNGASQEAALAYADGRSDSYQEASSSEEQAAEASEPATLTEFINQYGMTPVAYKIQMEGMSEEEALRSTPREMKTSGELQTGYTKYGIND